MTKPNCISSRLRDFAVHLSFEVHLGRSNREGAKTRRKKGKATLFPPFFVASCLRGESPISNSTNHVITGSHHNFARDTERFAGGAGGLERGLPGFVNHRRQRRDSAG